VNAQEADPYSHQVDLSKSAFKIPSFVSGLVTNLGTMTAAMASPTALNTSNLVSELSSGLRRHRQVSNHQCDITVLQLIFWQILRERNLLVQSGLHSGKVTSYSRLPEERHSESASFNRRNAGGHRRIPVHSGSPSPKSANCPIKFTTFIRGSPGLLVT